MNPDIPQICFGLSEKLDRTSFSNILQLLGRKEFADLLSARLSSEEINQAFDQITLILRNHLSEDEYHEDFLQNREKHSHPSPPINNQTL